MTILSKSFVILILSSLICSCNTFKGLGQDIQKGGENIENVAQDKKSNTEKVKHPR